MVFILGCGPGDTLAIDAKFTDQESYLIERAIKQWVSVTDSEDAAIFTFDGFDSGFFYAEDYDKSRGYSVIFKTDSSNPGYKKLAEEQGKSFIGVTNQRNGNIVIISDETGEATLKFYVTVLHELGHFYGIREHLSGNAVMRPSMKDVSTWCITPRDLSAFCDKNSCGPDAKSDCNNPPEIEFNQ